MATGFQVTYDCANPPKLADFWALALGYQPEPPPPGYASWPEWAREAGVPEEEWGDYAAVIDPDGVGPRLFFQRVPEPKTAKNRVHLDVNVGGPRGTPPEQRRARVAEAVTRLTAAGATRIREVDEPAGHFIVMTDPEGNEFCLQ
jgi:hypothetical protein